MHAHETPAEVQAPDLPAAKTGSTLAHVVPTRIRDAFGVLTVDAHGAWRFRMAADAPRAAPGRVLTRDYVVPLSDGSCVTLTIPVGTSIGDADEPLRRAERVGEPVSEPIGP